MEKSGSLRKHPRPRREYIGLLGIPDKAFIWIRESTIMKGSNTIADFPSSTFLFKIAFFFFLVATFFFVGKHFSGDSHQLIFFSATAATTTTTTASAEVTISPNFNQSLNVSSLIDADRTEAPNPAEPPPGPEARDVLRRFGILNENGKMSDEFEVGRFEEGVVEEWGNESAVEDSASVSRIALSKFGMCPRSMSEHIPCLDNADAIRKLESTERGERFERHCPKEGRRFNCLIPPPKGYRPPIPWPRSRDEVWYSNVPHTRLVEDKGGQNWISRGKDKFKFPGGGTQFIHGADQYLDHISEMVPDIRFGQNIRVALDVGCGVASFGAYLLSRNVITMSVAPKDVHENQIQFALERGVPAMVAAFATRRLLYPSQAFDLIHCSRCRINWTRDDGILLVEVNRILRAGGYFVWAAQPVYKHEEALEEQWEDGYVAIWQKPSDNSCYLNREAGTQPPMCDQSDDPDSVWYVNLKACVSQLPKKGYGANVARWPAPALIDQNLDSWVMNVVPVSGPNTLPVIYDRGLIGVMHDWCEPFDTYPRTYDLLHAANLLSVEKKRCNVSSIMLEMDRILRPGGRAYIRDTLAIMDELVEIGKAMGWQTTLRDTAEGPHSSYRVLVCDKRLLRG
ncbi:putative methyltransferase PMT11, partial [Mucuna pruriens]